MEVRKNKYKMENQLRISIKSNEENKLLNSENKYVIDLSANNEIDKSEKLKNLNL